MSNWARNSVAALFLIAAATGGEEFFRHMALEDNIQQQVIASKYVSERTGLIVQREGERGIAAISMLGGVVSLVAAGLLAAGGGKSAPKAGPG